MWAGRVPLSFWMHVSNSVPKRTSDLALMAWLKRIPEPGDDEKRMELTEHLGELRTRIIRSALYIAAGGFLSYFFFKYIYAFLFHPMAQALRKSGVPFKIVFTTFTQPFFVVLQISVVAGLIIVAPLVTLELWGFIRPALTRSERRPLRYVVPASVVLFILGVALAYWVAQFAMEWFIGYVNVFPRDLTPGAPGAPGSYATELYQDPKLYVVFMLKLMGAFGLVFQLPIVLVFLAWVGLLKAEMMRKSWRHAIVLISFIGMVVTPSNDAFTMLMMIIPVIILYIGSIGVVQIVERRRNKRMATKAAEGGGA